MFCSKCGAKLPDGAIFCPNCAQKVENNPFEQPQSEPFQQNFEPGSRQLSIAMVVWSIINILFSTIYCGAPALIFTILAAEEKTAKGEQEKLKIAKILNIVGTVLAVASVALVVVYFAYITSFFSSLLMM